MLHRTEVRPTCPTMCTRLKRSPPVNTVPSFTLRIQDDCTFRRDHQVIMGVERTAEVGVIPP